MHLLFHLLYNQSPDRSGDWPCRTRLVESFGSVSNTYTIYLNFMVGSNTLFQQNSKYNLLYFCDILIFTNKSVSNVRDFLRDRHWVSDWEPRQGPHVLYPWTPVRPSTLMILCISSLSREIYYPVFRVLIRLHINTIPISRVSNWYWLSYFIRC